MRRRIGVVELNKARAVRYDGREALPIGAAQISADLDLIWCIGAADAEKVEAAVGELAGNDPEQGNWGDMDQRLMPPPEFRGVEKIIDLTVSRVKVKRHIPAGRHIGQEILIERKRPDDMDVVTGRHIRIGAKRMMRR